MRRAAAVLLILLSAGGARAQQEAGPKPPDERRSDTGTTGMDFILGSATCRTGAYAEDPQLVRFTVAGHLVEDQARVQTVFDAAVPWTKKGRAYSEEACREVHRVADIMRYDLDIREVAVAGGLEVQLVMKPVTLVRFIDVRGNLSLLEGLVGLLQLQFSPVFREEIERRLRLRPGSTLEEDAERRMSQLAEEQQRILDYLARRGFFEATVDLKIESKPSPHEVTLVVTIHKGPAYTVGQVKVQGNSAVEDHFIIDAMQQKVCAFTICLKKARFDYEELKGDRERILEMYRERGYPAARVKTDFDLQKSPVPASKTVAFTVSVDERKKITVSFEGNHSKDEKTLRDLLTFNDAGAYDDYEAQRSAEAIRREYQGSGRFLTTVSFERERLEAPSERCPNCRPHDAIVFHIDEGPEQRVRAIRFRGNKTFSDAELRSSAVKTKEFPVFQYLFAGGGYVTSLQLQQDVERLVEHYHDQGFSQVKVEAMVGSSDEAVGDLGAVAAQVTSDDPRRGLTILFAIEEGPRDVVKEVEYRGNHELSSEELARRAREAMDDHGEGVLAGRPFTPAGLDAEVERIRRLYLGRGYLYVKVAPERTGTAGETRVIFHVEEGVKVHAGKVLVRGNFKTRDWVLHDALDLDEGDVLSIPKLDASQAGLRGTELFSSVRAPDLVGRDPVNLIIDVEERYDNKLDAEAAIGFSTDNSFFVGLILGLRNIAGIGVSFTLNGEVGLQRQRAQANLAFPTWVMKRAVRLPMKLDLQGRFSLEDTARFGRLRTLGGSAALSRTLAPGVFFSLRYDWNQFGRSTELVRGAGIYQEGATFPIRTTTASLGPFLLIDRRKPSALMPTSGYVAQGSVAVASRYLGGTDDFVKLGLAGQVFVPIGRVVIANTVRYDQGFPLGGAVLLPEVERFTAGGDTTVRGLEEDRLATEIIANDLSGAGEVQSFRVVPAGGNIRFLHKLDVQVRLLWSGISLASAVFLDTGFIANSFERFDIRRRFRHSIGLALARLVTPAGSISIEYAVPLDPEIGDDPTGRLHINVGFTF